MFTKLWYYDGAGRPVSELGIDTVFRLPASPRIIVMEQDEQDYLTGLQLVYGKAMTVYTLEEFHDYGWEHQKKNPLDQYLYNVCCSHSGLTELMLSPYGVERWKKVLKERERRQTTVSAYGEYNFDAKRMFI